MLIIPGGAAVLYALFEYGLTVYSIVSPKYTNQSGEVYEVKYNIEYLPNRTPTGLDAENANLITTLVSSHIQVKNLTTGINNYYEYISQYYDGFGNLVSKHIWDSNKGVWIEEVENRFDNQNQIVDSTNSNGDVNAVEYNAWGDISVFKDPFGNLRKSIYTLKSNSRIDYFIAKENISLESSDAIKENVVETLYDIRGNIIETIQYPFWPDKKEPIKREYTYDTVGNILSQKDGNGYITNFEYDKLNRLNAVINPLNERTEYHYDVFGNLNSVKQSDGTTIWETQKEYNELNNLASKTYPASGKETYEISPIGNLESKTDLNQNTHEYSYDGLNRLFTSQINNQKYKYYYQSNPFGPEKIEEINTDDNSVVGSDSYQYNYAGYIASHKNYTLGLVQQTSYTYDQLNRITRLVDLKGFATNYRYEKNRLSRVQTNGKQLESFQDSTSVNYEYFSDGKIKSLTYPPLSDGKKIKVVYTYDKLNRLDTVVNYIGSTIKSDFKYKYDNNDNITSITSSGSETQYVYDKVNRLKEITRPNGSKITYSYDSRGNRTQLTGLDDIKFEDTSYQYNALDQLESVKKGNKESTYLYNTEGLRSMKTVDSNKVLYNYDQQGRVISESDGSAQTQANYVWGHDRVFVKLDKSGGTEKQYYYLYNGHGDVIEIVDSNGTSVNSYQYDEWGNIKQQVEGTKNPFKYAGEVYDEESGLYYLRARYYDPSMGRFISKDTYEGNITNPLSLNQYTYVGNNPLIYVDPSGHMQLNQIDSLLNGIAKSGYDAVKDLINTPEALWQLLYGMATGSIGFSDLAKAMGSSIVGPIDYLIDNFKSAILNPFATDKAVYNYGVQLGNVLQMIVGSASGGAAIKIISGFAPDLGKLLTKAAKAEGCNCFTAGTKVLTDEGEKNIEDIEIGDKVLSKNAETGEQAYKEVTHLYRNDKEITYELIVGAQIIETTENHPFWVEGKGWVFAADLQVGDKLQQSNGNTLKIDKINIVTHDELVKVYNFTVAEFHTYYVSSLGIWVHNISCGEINWKGFSSGKLKSHWEKHGHEFGKISQNEYLKLAKGFAAETNSSFKEQVVGNFIVKYDPATGRVLVGHIKDRQIRTFYKDDGRSNDPFQAAIDLAKSLGGG
jgi:RHS repeat-associated protein